MSKKTNTTAKKNTKEISENSTNTEEKDIKTDNNSKEKKENSESAIAKDTTTESNIVKTSKTTKNNSTSLVATLGKTSQDFYERYKDILEDLDLHMPSLDDMEEAIDKLTDEQQEAFYGFLRRTNSRKVGMMDEKDSRPDMTELRLFHGTGNDPLRPDDLIPGHFYLTTGENVGKTFLATPIVIWNGNTYWAATDDSSSKGAPICQSMDQVMGYTFGLCRECPKRPWKNGERNDCGNDVLALMLRKDLSDVVLVRFSKTSSPAGSHLKKLTRKGMHLWSHWYEITAQPGTSDKNKNLKWFEMQVARLTGPEGKTPKDIHQLCEQTSYTFQGSYVMPARARIYAQAEENKQEYSANDSQDGGNIGPTSEDTSPQYNNMNDMSDAPDV